MAEDEVMLRVATEEMLQDEGFEVFSAGDGEEALGLLKTRPEIDLLITDVRMPYMDGVTLAKAGLEHKPALKILMVTAYAADIPPDLGKRLIGVLRKPFSLVRLCEIARELLN